MDNSRTMAQAPNTYYRQAKFLISAASKKQFPKDGAIEVAFAGRSNAGKSSAINTLCDNKSLAKISKTPGRTRLVIILTWTNNAAWSTYPVTAMPKSPFL